MTQPTPYKFQLEDCRRIYRQFSGRCLVAWDMGLGKSLLSYLYAARHNLFPMVVVCNASLKWQWEEQAREHFGMRAEVLEGSEPRRVASNAKILIINYDILFQRNREDGKRRGPGWVKVLKELGVKLVVFDESQALQSRNSKRTKASYKLVDGVDNVLCLSGTPILMRPAELFPTLNILRPDKFPSFWPFARRYCNARRNPFGGWDVKGASNLDKLHAKMSRHCMVRRTKEEVLSQLPKKMRIVVPLPIENPREYREAVDNFIRWLTSKDIKRARKAAKAERMVKIGYLLRLAASLKMKYQLQWVDDFLRESDGKIALFAVHRKILDLVRDKYDGIAIKVDGGVTGDKRKLAFRKFLTSKKCRILVTNISTGWNGRGVGAVGLMEFPWAPGTAIQMEDRIFGIKRGVEGKRPMVYYFPSKGTVEERLLRILQDRQKTVRSVLDGGEFKDDLDVFDLLAKQLRKEGGR